MGICQGPVLRPCVEAEMISRFAAAADFRCQAIQIRARLSANRKVCQSGRASDRLSYGVSQMARSPIAIPYTRHAMATDELPGASRASAGASTEVREGRESYEVTLVTPYGTRVIIAR